MQPLLEHHSRKKLAFVLAENADVVLRKLENIKHVKPAEISNGSDMNFQLDPNDTFIIIVFLPFVHE